MPLSNCLLLSSINIIYFMCINFVRMILKKYFLLVTNSMICKNKENSFRRYHAVSQIFDGLYKNKNFCSNDHTISKLRISKWRLSDIVAGLTSFTKVNSKHHYLSLYRNDVSAISSQALLLLPRLILSIIICHYIEMTSQRYRRRPYFFYQG